MNSVEQQRAAKRHQVQARASRGDLGRPVWRCSICGRRVIQVERFLLMRDESGASLGSTEKRLTWRHRPIRKGGHL